MTCNNFYMLVSSCHVYHFKRFILYSQAILLNSICSEISSYDHRCKVTNWLGQKSLNIIVVRVDIIIVRVDFINHQKDIINDESLCSTLLIFQIFLM